MTEHQTPRFVSRLTRDTLALILAGGRGTRLKQLTDWHAKPAVPFGGKFRIIDFPLSNCINSGIRRVGVLTQYKAHSLIQHIQRGWGFLRGEFGEFVELLPAQQRIQDSWYTGTADAIYQNIDIIRNHNPKFVLILGGDHVYKMDYGPMIAEHVEKSADLSVGCVEVPVSEAGAYGVMSVTEDGRVTSFAEKPEKPQPLPGRDDVALVSMGIYIFNTEFLIEQLLRDVDTKGSSHDFGHDIVPASMGRYRTFAYAFNDPALSDSKRDGHAYWRDVGTVDAYWQANLELIGVTPELNLYDEHWPIWTYQEQLPPAKFVFDDNDRRGMAVDSMVSGGCVVSGASIRHSVLFSNVRVNSYTQVEDTIVLPNAEIGRHCRIHKAVIDQGCYIPEGTVIGENPEQDEARFHVTEGGVTLIVPEMLGQKIHHVR
jgi:glucose-1-phosphate adenylyltransferase